MIGKIEGWIPRKRRFRRQDQKGASAKTFSEAIQLLGGTEYALAELLEKDLDVSEKEEILLSVKRELEAVGDADEDSAAEALARGIVQSPPGLAMTNPKVKRVIVAAGREVAKGEVALPEVTRQLQRDGSREWRKVDKMLSKLEDRLKKLYRQQIPEDIADPLRKLQDRARDERVMPARNNFPKLHGDLICLIYSGLSQKGFGKRASSRIIAKALINLKMIDDQPRAANRIYDLLRYHLGKPGGIST